MRPSTFTAFPRSEVLASESGNGNSGPTGTNVFDSVVILSPYPWIFQDGMWQTTHHIAREFARLCPTLLVEPAPQWDPRTEWFQRQGLPRSLFGSRTSAPVANLFVFHRQGLPLGRFSCLRNFALLRNARSLRRLLKRWGFRRTLLWHSFPYWSEPLVEAVDYTFFAYHCLDHSTREEEVGLIRCADAVFCVSEALVQKHRAVNPHTYLLSNGVDLGTFAAGSLRDRRPADLPADGRLIGFVGSINRHLDIELLLQIAETFPHDCLVIGGRIPGNQTAPQGRQLEALRRLRSRPNVRMLGFIPTPKLAVYLNAFDVCLIPFLQNLFNRECDPLKFYQYMALGKPVVSTPVEVAARYPELCYLAGSSEEFLRSISQALGELECEALRRQRIEFARAHNWNSRVAQACQILSGLQNPRSPSGSSGCP